MPMATLRLADVDIAHLLIDALLRDRFLGVGLQLVDRNVRPRAHLAGRLRIVALRRNRREQANRGRESQHRPFHANLPIFVMVRSWWRFFRIGERPDCEPGQCVASIKRLPIIDKLTPLLRGIGGTETCKRNIAMDMDADCVAACCPGAPVRRWAHPVAAAELTHFKVGISEPVNTVLALWMAHAAGFMRRRASMWKSSA